jgi:hypothetical protein
MSANRDGPALTKKAAKLILAASWLIRSRNRLIRLLEDEAPAFIIARELGVLHKRADEIAELSLHLQPEDLTEE